MNRLRRIETLDSYARRARLYPALIASIPAFFLLIAASFSAEEFIRLSGLLVAAVSFVICGLVRDRGLKVQPKLWEKWGGSPTIQRLRWSQSGDSRTVERLHTKISTAIGSVLPTPKEESADPGDADARYEEVVSSLRERTRDSNRYRLVFEQNVEYGFRRNSLGLRPISLGVAAMCLVASLLALLVGDWDTSTALLRWISSAVISAIAGFYWAFVVSESWVHRSAELYADRLFEAIDR